MLFACSATDDFFRARIDYMIDLRHSMVMPYSRIPWQHIEVLVPYLFMCKTGAGVATPDLDLFCEALGVVEARASVRQNCPASIKSRAASPESFV